MIHTEVKKLGENEHMVHVKVEAGEYQRIYNEQIRKLAQKAKLPGFRPGKTPNNVIEKQYGDQLRSDTVSELIQTHYVGAIEASGLNPAVQPQLEVVPASEDGGFEFTMKVTTWPNVDVKDLDKLKFDVTTVTVEDYDVDQVMERLRKSQVKFEIEADRAAESGDQLHIDFVGTIDGEAFDGGKGEDVALVLGEGRFIPGFEDQLIGKKAGDDVTVEVTFPEDYQAAHLAGKAASFATTIRSVGVAKTTGDDDELAKMLGFDDAAALRDDARARLALEAEQASYQSTKEDALDVLLKANPVEVPEGLIEHDVRETAQRVLQNMKQQGMEVGPEMMQDEEFIGEVRKRSERGLKLSILLQSITDAEKLELDESEVEAEIDRQAVQYPPAQRDQFKQWIKSQQDQMAGIRDALLERHCINHIITKSGAQEVYKPLSEWQAESGQ